DLPRVHPRAVRIEPYFVGPAIAQVLPAGELPRIRWVGNVHDVQESADTKGVLGEVVRLAVRGEVALVSRAAWQVDAGLQNRVATVGRDVINRKIRPTDLADHEEAALSVHLRSFVRGKRRGRVGQVRARLWVLWVRGIDHRQAGVLLQRSNSVRSIVGAGTVVRWSILGIISLTLELPNQLQIHVVGPLGIAAGTLLRRRLAL